MLRLPFSTTSASCTPANNPNYRRSLTIFNRGATDLTVIHIKRVFLSLFAGYVFWYLATQRQRASALLKMDETGRHSLTHSVSQCVCSDTYVQWYHVKLDVDCWLLFFVVFPFFLLWATNLRLIKSNFSFKTLDLFYIHLCCWLYERAVESTTFAATLENLAVFLAA